MQSDSNSKTVTSWTTTRKLDRALMTSVLSQPAPAIATHIFRTSLQIYSLIVNEADKYNDAVKLPHNTV